MHYPSSLLDRLGELPSSSWSGRVFRCTFEGIPPERPNTRGARWNPPGVAALYTGFSKDVVRAEIDYLIAAQGIAPTRGRLMHTLSLSLGSVLEITDPDVLLELGINAAALGSIDHTLCQRVGGAVERLRHAGLIVPSARGPANNLIVYLNNLPYGTPIDILASEPITPSP